jgi:hypothetical protein
MAAIIALALVALIMLSDKKENFIEAFGFSGHSAPNPPKFDKQYDTAGYTEEDTVVERDQVHGIIQSVMAEMDICGAYPLETNQIRKMTKAGSDPIYRCSFTFMITDGGFPVGIGVQSDVTHTNEVLSLRTQPIQASDINSSDVKMSGGEYADFELISEKSAPTMDALKAAEKSFYN